MQATLGIYDGVLILRAGHVSGRESICVSWYSDHILISKPFSVVTQRTFKIIVVRVLL